MAITLTAVCASGSPTSYAWTGGNCANVTTQSCQAIGNNQTVTYGVTPSNGIGAGNTPTKQVVWSNAAPVKPSSCSITADVNPLPAGGGSVNLTAQCSGGDSVDTWTWSGPVTTSSGNTATAAISVSSTFGVTATNGGGNGSASLTVSVSGNGGGGAISCAGFLNTNVVTATWPNWPNPTGGLKMPMGPLDALVVKFTTGPTGSSQTGKLILFSGSGQDSAHDAMVSTTPCDFTTNVLNSQKFTIGTRISGSIPVLTLNTTYYINIKNSAGAVCINGTFPCDLFMNLVKPSNL
ncbi:MAG: hypothetical protein ACREYB_06060 [Casimicrobiaceae bacterium]